MIKSMFLIFIIKSVLFSNVLLLEDTYYEVKNEILNEQQYLLDNINNLSKNDKIIKKYGFNLIKLNEENILKRVQPIPKDIMLSQAYLESDNGQSRFATEGYNYFGIWTYDKTKDGFIPKRREIGKTHRIQKFNSMKERIHRYSEILNSSMFYKNFRENRFKILNKYNFNNDFAYTLEDNLFIIKGLKKYSQDKIYINKIKDLLINKYYLIKN